MLVALLPATVLMAVFAVGLLLLAGQSLLTPHGLGLEHYRAFAERPDYVATLWRTLRFALWTTFWCVLIGYPVAHTISRARRFRTLMTILVVLPWMVSVVVRSYGWMVLLGNRGTLNSFLIWAGIIDAPLRLMFTPTGILIGLVHVFCPFMILSLLAVMAQFDHALEEASMSLGAGPIGTFLRVTLPLTLPGLVAGASIVFLLTTGAVVTPLLLGGPRDPMLAMQIYRDVFQLFNFERASAMAFILMALALAVVLPLHWIEKRTRRLQAQPA